MTEKNLIKFYPDIVNRICPTCSENTMLVGLTKDFYRCLTCGSDLQQHINGKISYLPTMSARTKFREHFNYGEEKT